MAIGVKHYQNRTTIYNKYDADDNGDNDDDGASDFDDDNDDDDGDRMGDDDYNDHYTHNYDGVMAILLKPWYINVVLYRDIHYQQSTRFKLSNGRAMLPVYLNIKP